MKKLAFALTLITTSLFGEPSTLPSSRVGESWYAIRHWEILNRVSQKNVDMIFIGDSITQMWESWGSNTWYGFYAPRNGVNLGFSGDMTQHVLWRLENGQIDGISPKVAVVLIGTNNLYHTVQEVADGIEAVCRTIQTKLSKTKILLLGLLPRDDFGPLVRQKNREINSLIAKLADDNQLFFLDIGHHFLDSFGNVRQDLMPDLLHLSTVGYQVCATVIEPTIIKLLGVPA